MKQLSNRLKVGAVILAVAFAVFANVKKTEAATVRIDYFWFYDEAATSFTCIDNTIPFMEDLTGCTGSSYDCVYGYRAEDFNEWGNALSGLKTEHSSPIVLKEI
ncbi:MAG: hypothetical protein V4557_19975 [Bacteroidota bacterium]